MKSFEQAKREDDERFGGSDWESMLIEEADELDENERKNLLDEARKNLVWD